jgi:hypothetical protein
LDKDSELKFKNRLIPTDSIEVSQDQHLETVNLVRINQCSKMLKELKADCPIFTIFNGKKHTLLAGALQFELHKNLNKEVINGIIFENIPPKPLIELANSRGKRFNNTFELAKWICELNTEFGYSFALIGRLLGQKRQTISELNKINDLPNEIIQDGLQSNLIGQKKLITLARKNVSDAEKIKEYCEVKNSIGQDKKKETSEKIILGIQNVTNLIYKYLNELKQKEQSFNKDYENQIKSEIRSFIHATKQLMKCKTRLTFFNIKK